MNMETITIPPDLDIADALRAAFPLGARLVAQEGGLPIFLIGARALMTSPNLAAEVLDAPTLRRWGTAVQALGQQHQAVGERMIEIAEERGAHGPSTPVKASSGALTADMQPTNTDSIASRARERARGADGER
jgi:hypothetical protein